MLGVLGHLSPVGDWAWGPKDIFPQLLAPRLGGCSPGAGGGVGDGSKGGVSTCALFQGGPRGWWSGCTPGTRLKVPGVGLEEWLAGTLHRLQTVNQLGLAVILSGQDSPHIEPHRTICDPGSGPWAHQATWPGQAVVTGVARVGVSLGLPDVPKVPCGLSIPRRAHCAASPGVGTCHSLHPLLQLGSRSGLRENTCAP